MSQLTSTNKQIIDQDHAGQPNTAINKSWEEPTYAAFVTDGAQEKQNGDGYQAYKGIKRRVDAINNHNQKEGQP